MPKIATRTILIYIFVMTDYLPLKIIRKTIFFIFLMSNKWFCRHSR